MLPFTPITTTEFSDEVLEQAVHLPFENREPATRFKVTFGDGRAAGRITIHFLDNLIEYFVPTIYRNAEHRLVFTNRWLCTRPVFGKVAELYPSLRGTCHLWIGDRPRGPGLVFCGNSVGQVCIPDCSFLSSTGYTDLRAEVTRDIKPWSSRKKTVFWRGGAPDYPNTGPWQAIPRLALCLKAAETNENDLFDIGISAID